MKNVKIAALAVAMLGAAVPATHAADGNLQGVWLRGDGNAKVRIAPCGSKICATNVWIKDTSGGENVGDRLVMGLKSKSPDMLSGTAFDPKRNLSYSITLKVAERKLVTRGCIAGGILCKTVNWVAAK